MERPDTKTLATGVAVFAATVVLGRSRLARVAAVAGVGAALARRQRARSATWETVPPVPAEPAAGGRANGDGSR